MHILLSSGTAPCLGSTGLGTGSYKRGTLLFKQTKPSVSAAWSQWNLSSSTIQQISCYIIHHVPYTLFSQFCCASNEQILLAVLMDQENINTQLCTVSKAFWYCTLHSVVKRFFCLQDSDRAEDVILPSFIAHWSHWDFITDENDRAMP